MAFEEPHRISCIALAEDFRVLYAFARRIVAAEQTPLLASKPELAIELSSRLGQNMFLVCAPHGNLSYVRDIGNRIVSAVVNARIIFEVADEQAEPWTSTTKTNVLYLIRRSAPASELRALIDVATFAPGLVGSVNEIELIDILQLCIMNRQSRALRVQGHSGSGLIVIKEGCIVDARLGQSCGNDALYQILGQTRGQFHEEKMPVHVEATVNGKSEMLILEAMRRRDESQRGT